MAASLRNLKAGSKVRIDGHEHVFLGFSNNRSKYGAEGVAFVDWADLAAAKGFGSFKDLDAEDEGREYGYSHYAVFREVADNFVWSAYRFNGRWVLGSSADALKLEVV